MQPWKVIVAISDSVSVLAFPYNPITDVESAMRHGAIMRIPSYKMSLFLYSDLEVNGRLSNAVDFLVNGQIKTGVTGSLVCFQSQPFGGPPGCRCSCFASMNNHIPYLEQESFETVFVEIVKTCEQAFSFDDIQ